jgi:hypothetical protein
MMIMNPSTRVWLGGVLVLAIGCAAPADDTAGAADVNAPEAAASASSDSAYPALYREMRLPQLPGAQVMSTGRQETSLRDGLAIRATTSMSVGDARNYVSQALTDEGWTEAPARVLPGLAISGLTATKGDLSYTATFTSNGDATQVAINVVQN